MARRKASSGSDSTKPKVHVTPTGGMYVHADELLRTPEVRETIKRMTQIAKTQTSGHPSSLQEDRKHRRSSRRLRMAAGWMSS